MNKVYKAHILFTKEKNSFEVFENGYVAVVDGRVAGVASSMAELNVQDAEFVDFGDCLLIPAMNDMHVHAPQVRNQGVAMDLELLPWLQNYTFPEESKYANIQYAERMYRRFLHTQWLFGTMRSCVFGTVHTESTRLLMKLYKEAGMGALVGKVAMNRNCPEALCEDVEAYVEGQESLIAEANSSPFTLHSLLLSAPLLLHALCLRVHRNCSKPAVNWPTNTNCPYSRTCRRTPPRLPGWPNWRRRAPAMAMPTTAMGSLARHLPSWPTACGQTAASWN